MTCSNINLNVDITSTFVDAGKGPMHLAGFIGNNRAVSTLLSYKAPVDTTDNSGRTALHWAVRKHHHTTDLLLKKGADVNKPNKDGAHVTYLTVH